MKRKNGFTLVELLVVIVILAVIMIIAIPSVLSVLTTGRVKSFSTYAKKAVLATEQRNAEEEMKQRISDKGVYAYSIKDDLDLPNTGSYDGYVVVDDCTEKEKQFYVYLADGEFMAYDFHYADNAEIIDSSTFGDYNEEVWKKVAGSKEIVAAQVVVLTGGYTCSIFGLNDSEVIGTGADIVPNLPSSHNAAVFKEGPDVDYIMLNEVAGNKQFNIVTHDGRRFVENIKYTNGSGGWENLTDLTDMTIKAVKKTNSITEAQKASAKIVSTDTSPNPIYMWFESGTVYWYTDAEKVFANQNARGMFAWLGAVKTIDVSEIDFSQTTDISGLFECDKNITSLDVSSMNVVNVTNMDETFYCLESLKSLDISMWNTSNVTELAYMFGYLASATSIRFPRNLVTSKVTIMEGLFYEDNAVKSLDVSEFDTSNATSFYALFRSCRALTTLDLSKWKTSNVKNMREMFMDTTSLVSVDVTGWDTSNVTDMYQMFYNADGIRKLVLSSFNVSKVTTFESMFGLMDSVTMLDLSNWYLGSKVNATNMFRESVKLKTIYVSESWKDHIGSDSKMFYNSKALVGGDGTKYNFLFVGKSRAVIDGDGFLVFGYFTEKKK